MTRDEAKATAVLRAQLSLKHALERIDFQHDVIAPKLAELKAAAQEGEVVLEIGAPEEELQGLA
jgi:hypothetical protein